MLRKPLKVNFWVAMYEKAYANFLKYTLQAIQMPIAQQQQYNDDLDFGQFPLCDPITPLSHITGFPALYQPGNGLDQTVYNPSNNLNGCTSSFEVLATRNCQQLGILGNAAWTAYPTVAWTHAAVVGNMDPKSYNTDILVPSHAYSLLGLFVEDYGNSYIVLRNPWANLINPSSFPDNEDFNYLKQYLATGLWYPDQTDVPFVTFGNDADGIFAIRTELFDLCFEGFGWVTPGS